MLTTTPKQGDRVLVVQNWSRNSNAVIGLEPIEKIGRKYITITMFRPVQFTFDGANSDYELFDNQEAYDRHLQRDRDISKIKNIVSVWKFGDGLTDETLNQILELIEVKK